MQQKALSAVIGLIYIEFLMEHHLSKLTTSSATSDIATAVTTSATTEPTFRPTYSHVSESLRENLVNSIISIEFYGVPADVIKSLIREHLPEYTL